GDGTGTWKKFPTLVCQDQKFSDVDVLIINYPTFMMSRNAHVIDLATWIDKKLTAEEMWPRYKKIAVVAHSMGGLIAREIILTKQLQGSNFNVGFLVEIGSPHMGSNVAKLASALGLSNPLTEEMSPNSELLVTLRSCVFWVKRI